MQPVREPFAGELDGVHRRRIKRNQLVIVYP
jgi:hypothetical protein